MTFPAKYRTACLWLERHSVMFTAIVTNYFEPLRRFGVTYCSFFRAAFGTPLRRHHIPLIEHFLVLFAKNEDLFALHTWDFDIRHTLPPSR